MKTRVQNAKNIHIYSVSVINPLEFQFDKKKSLYFVTTKAVRIIPTSGWCTKTIVFLESQMI